MLKLLTYLGPVKFVIAATLLSIVASTAMSACAQAIFFPTQGASALIVSAVVPAIIAPSILSGFVRLYTELHRTRLQLVLLASCDELTGVLNRRKLFEEGTAHAARALRSGRQFSVLMLDVDHFKKINDSVGHIGGDEALKSIARVCSGALRTTDVLARYGGEEFAIILVETGTKDAYIAAERIRAKVMSELFQINGVHLPITISIGGATWSPEILNFTNLLSMADGALYRAKAAGRNRVEFSVEPFGSIT